MPNTDAPGIIDTKRTSQVLLTTPPFVLEMQERGLWCRGQWPASWIGPECTCSPVVFAVRHRFETNASCIYRIHVSADERYELLLDGKLVGRGPERGDLANWFYESFDLNLAPGNHLLVARVWAMGIAAPRAQVSAGPGFLLAGEAHAKSISTGIGRWEIQEIGGISPIDHPAISHDGFAGKKHRHDGKMHPNGIESGEVGTWYDATVLVPACAEHTTENISHRLLRPAMLPPMMSRWITNPQCRFAERNVVDINASVEPARNDTILCHEIEKLLDGCGPLRVPPKTHIRAVIDLGDYYCGYTHLVASNGADTLVKVDWAESLYISADSGGAKGQRDAVDGKYFIGTGDEFVFDGTDSRAFRSLWWSAGRYLQIEIRSGSQTIILHRLRIEETRYPLEITREIATPSTEWTPLLKLCRRSIEVGSHEHFTDSPYYEQIGYTGDARLESLCWYSLTEDDRLVRKQLELYDSSRVREGFTQSRTPCSVPQIIPTFSLIYVEMVNDFLIHRGDRLFVRGLLPGIRLVLDAFISRLGEDGLVDGLPGWNFIDWAGGHFVNGEVDPDSAGKNALVNLQLVIALNAAIELERSCGESVFVDRFERYASSVMDAACKLFWVDTRGLFADTPGHTALSQHGQILALLTKRLSKSRYKSCFEALVNNGALVQTTIYFKHYLFEVLHHAGRADLIEMHLDPWREAVANGLRCTPESPEPSRSDSHAWSAHLLYHAAKIALRVK